MMDEKAPEVDLLGDPWREPKDQRGRKRHRWSKQIAENIAVLKASGLTADVIASRVQLSEPTMRKYYFRELAEGAELAQAVLHEVMWKKALEGNVSAARFVREQFAKGATDSLANRVRERASAEPKKGKKEERLDLALGVGGKYAPPAPPRLQ